MTEKYWHCERRDICNGSCVTNYYVNREIKIISVKQHAHEGDQTKIVVQEILRGIKRQARHAVPPRYPPDTWKVYQQVIHGQQQANNNVEERHSRFQKLITTHHASL